MAGGVRDVVINFLGNASGLTNAANQGAGSMSRFSDRTQKAAKIGLAAAGAFGVALVGSLKAGVEGLLEGEEAEAKLSDALSRAPKVIMRQSDAIKANAEEIQKRTKFAYEDALAASTQLAAQDGVNAAIKAGVTDAKSLQTVALDLATVMKVDAAGGAKLLGKALAAPEKASAVLRKAGINLTAAQQDQIKAWVKSGDTAKAQGFILDQLKKKTEGAADAAGNTMAGKVERAQNAFGEMQESLAAGLIPVLGTLTDVGLKVSGWLQDNPGKVKVAVVVLGGLAVVIGVVSAAIKAWTAITKIATGVQAAFNFVMSANPIALVTIAIVAVGAALVVAYQKSETFRKVVDAAFTGLKTVVVTVLQTMSDLILGFWGMIIDGAAKAFGWIPGLGGKLKSAQKGFHAFRDDVNSTLAGIKDKKVTVTVQMLKKDWDQRAVDAQGNTVYGPVIPKRAMGGPVSAGRLHLVGERGPELFVPKGDGTIIPNDALGGAWGGGPETLELTLDLGHGIHEVVQINLRDQSRNLVRANAARSRRS